MKSGPVTGDVHGGAEYGSSRFSSKSWPDGRTLSRDDVVVVAGDFGFVWDGSNTDRYWLDWFESKPWTTCFVDGNHENHRMLAELPETEWNGGRVHVARPHLPHPVVDRVRVEQVLAHLPRQLLRPFAHDVGHLAQTFNRLHHRCSSNSKSFSKACAPCSKSRQASLNLVCSSVKLCNLAFEVVNLASKAFNVASKSFFSASIASSLPERSDAF